MGTDRFCSLSSRLLEVANEGVKVHMTRLVSPPKSLLNALDHGKVASRPRAWCSSSSAIYIGDRSIDKPFISQTQIWIARY